MTKRKTKTIGNVEIWIDDESIPNKEISGFGIGYTIGTDKPCLYQRTGGDYKVLAIFNSQDDARAYINQIGVLLESACQFPDSEVVNDS